jgi:predicted lipoprotein with Yx(FWY)xxD motif
MIPIRLAGNRTGRLQLGATAVAALVTACGGASTGSTASSGGGGAAAGGPATISMTQASAGTVLTGPSGKTVYILVDSSGKPVACTSGCLAVWPPVTITGMPQAGSGVTASLSTAASGGSTQAAANGDPLYYYSGDSSAGQVNGQGLMSFGGTWYALQASGQKVTGSSGGGAQTQPGPGGY